MQKLADYLADKDMSYIVHYLAKLEDSYLYAWQKPIYHVKDIDYKESIITVEACEEESKEEKEIWTTEHLKGSYIFNDKEYIIPGATSIVTEISYKVDPNKTKKYTIYANEECILIGKLKFDLTNIENTLRIMKHFDIKENDYGRIFGSEW